MGTIIGMSDVDPLRWPNSKWRSLQVIKLIIYLFILIIRVIAFMLQRKLPRCILYNGMLILSDRLSGTSLDAVISRIELAHGKLRLQKVSLYFPL